MLVQSSGKFLLDVAFPSHVLGRTMFWGQQLALLSLPKPSAAVMVLARVAVPGTTSTQLMSFGICHYQRPKQEMNQFAIKAAQPSVAPFSTERAL
jgi:hypothetical protein